MSGRIKRPIFPQLTLPNNPPLTGDTLTGTPIVVSWRQDGVEFATQTFTPSQALADPQIGKQISAVYTIGGAVGGSDRTAAVQVPDLTSGLRGFYPLTANANDTSGHGANLTNNGSVTFSGAGAAFNGVDQGLEILNSALNLTGPNFTYTGFVSLLDLITDATMILGLPADLAGVFFRTYIGNKYQLEGSPQIPQNGTAPDGSEQFISFTFDGTTGSLEVGGVAATAATVISIAPTNHFCIAQDNAGASNANCVIRKVGVWNRVLTGAELLTVAGGWTP